MTPSKKRGPPTDDHTEVVPIDDGDDPDSTQHTPAPSHPTPTRRNSMKDYNLAAGSTLGEYRIEAKIGSGGMGDVFSAVHPLIGKRAAIKILKLELCTDPFNVERFVDEARVVNEIGHGNIVDVFAFGEMPDGRCYFVMEWLKGETLRARIARTPVTLGELVAIVRPLARALDAAHAKGIVHRDLKPDNIFLVESDEQPTVKLLDFGIAKLARTDHRIERTATGAMVGTPMYIAPEQAKGYAIDHRADIYALGGIVFEMLTGRPPFVADNAMEIVAKHLMEQPVRASTLAERIPRELDDLVLDMLDKDPQKRPSLVTLCAVLDDLRKTRSQPFLRVAPATVVSGPPPAMADDASELQPTTERAIVTPEPEPPPISHDAPTPQPMPALDPITEPSSALDIATAESPDPLEDTQARAQALIAARVAALGESGPNTAFVRVPRHTTTVLAIAGFVAAAVIAFVIVTATSSSPDLEPPPPQAREVSIDPPPPSAPPIADPAVAEPAPVVPVPPTPKRPATAMLRVHVNVAAEVWIDGKLIGRGTTVTAPRSELGAHIVEVRAPGMRVKRMHVDVQVKGTVTNVKLEPIPRPVRPPPTGSAKPPDDKDLYPPGVLKPKDGKR